MVSGRVGGDRYDVGACCGHRDGFYAVTFDVRPFFAKVPFGFSELNGVCRFVWKQPSVKRTASGYTQDMEGYDS